MADEPKGPAMPIPVINDLADDLLAGDHDATIVTQATADLDNMPAPYMPDNDQDDEANTFAGLSGAPHSRKARMKGTRQAHARVRQGPIRQNPTYAGFLPGMGDDSDLSDDDLGDEDLSGPGGTVKRRAKVRTGKVGPKPTVVRRARAPQRIHAGFLPGMGDMGDVSGASISLPVIALVGLAAWYLLRRK
jgi:hypothetical protein